MKKHTIIMTRISHLFLKVINPNSVRPVRSMLRKSRKQFPAYAPVPTSFMSMFLEYSMNIWTNCEVFRI